MSEVKILGCRLAICGRNYHKNFLIALRWLYLQEISENKDNFLESDRPNGCSVIFRYAGAVMRNETGLKILQYWTLRES